MPPPPPPAPMAQTSLPPAPAPNALLKSIEKGTKLKKTITNDRSGPIIEGNPNIQTQIGHSNHLGRSNLSKQSNGSSKSPPNSRNPTSNAPMAPQLGGLFAGGIPKLNSSSGNNLHNINPPAPILPKQAPMLPPSTVRNVVSKQPPQPPQPPLRPPEVQQHDNPNSIPRSPPLHRNNAPAPPSRSPLLPRTNAPPPPFRSPPLAGRQSVPDISNRQSAVENRYISKSPEISPRNSITNVPLENSPHGSISSLPGTEGRSKIVDGRWTFIADIPVPRLFPSGETPAYSRPAPPPPPSRNGSKRVPFPR